MRALLRRLAPDAVFCQSAATMRYLAGVGISATFLPSGVDAERFRPATAERKAALRGKYGLPEGEFLVLHAGHLVRGRNAGLLGKLEGIGRGVMLAGRSMGLDAELKRELEESGVIVVDRYVEDVEELYQSCDCYLFPVREDDSAMEFPLSVLEAMACNLPVVAHPYGGLPLALEPRDGLVFAKSDDGLLAGVREARGGVSDTRSQALALTWERAAERLLETMKVKKMLELSPPRSKEADAIIEAFLPRARLGRAGGGRARPAAAAEQVPAAGAGAGGESAPAALAIRALDGGAR